MRQLDNPNKLISKPRLVHILLVLLSIMSFHLANAQNSVVYGRVYAFKDLCLMNIKVTSQKAKTSVQTDSLGHFMIVCDEKDKLTFTGHGFQTVYKRTKGNDTIQIKMVFKTNPDNEEVAIGYGHVSKDKLSYAINHDEDYNNDYCNYSDIFSLIQGKFAGVQIINYTGTQVVLIRGITTFDENIGALYVVNGTIVSDISFINPVDVKDINILKDSSASIYGSRGANGAVIINTH